MGQEINLLKTFLNDKISSINQMKDELKYKDIDSNTIDGVRNVNELGKSDSNLLKRTSQNIFPERFGKNRMYFQNSKLRNTIRTS